MAMTATQFAQLVCDSRLADADQMESILERLEVAAREVPVEVLARVLVKHQILTPWQARQIAAGQGRNLNLDGRYHLLARLGKGGMANVFRAWDARLRRLVVVKIPRPELQRDEQTLAWFLREMTVTARLQHPHIVRAFDAGKHRSLHYIVMEFVDGEDLASRLTRKIRLRPERAVDLARQAALGLECAHAHGVVHRDIKPANLLVARDGTLKVLDFGFASLKEASARHKADAASMTQNLGYHGRLLGTCHYAAPEQIANAADADIRSDLYSLGASLYQMLAGRPPFLGDTVVETFLNITSNPLEPIPGLDDTLQGILGRCLAKEPAERYQEPTQLLAALDEWTRACARPLVKLEPPQRGKPAGVKRDSAYASALARSG